MFHDLNEANQKKHGYTTIDFIILWKHENAFNHILQLSNCVFKENLWDQKFCLNETAFINLLNINDLYKIRQFTQVFNKTYSGFSFYRPHCTIRMYLLSGTDLVPHFTVEFTWFLRLFKTLFANKEWIISLWLLKVTCIILGMGRSTIHLFSYHLELHCTRLKWK